MKGAAPVWLPYVITIVSTVISLLLGGLLWFAKRELQRITKSDETDKADIKTLSDKLDKAVHEFEQRLTKEVYELKLSVQSTYVDKASFERQESVVQEHVANVKGKLGQINTNLAFLVKMNKDNGG